MSSSMFLMVCLKSPSAPWPECAQSKSVFTQTQGSSGPPESEITLCVSLIQV